MSKGGRGIQFPPSTLFFPFPPLHFVPILSPSTFLFHNIFPRMFINPGFSFYKVARNCPNSLYTSTFFFPLHFPPSSSSLTFPPPCPMSTTEGVLHFFCHIPPTEGVLVSPHSHFVFPSTFVSSCLLSTHATCPMIRKRDLLIGKRDLKRETCYYTYYYWHICEWQARLADPQPSQFSVIIDLGGASLRYARGIRSLLLCIRSLLLFIRSLLAFGFPLSPP